MLTTLIRPKSPVSSHVYIYLTPYSVIASEIGVLHDLLLIFKILKLKFHIEMKCHFIEMTLKFGVLIFIEISCVKIPVARFQVLPN